MHTVLHSEPFTHRIGLGEWTHSTSVTFFTLGLERYENAAGRLFEHPVRDLCEQTSLGYSDRTVSQRPFDDAKDSPFIRPIFRWPPFASRRYATSAHDKRVRSI